MILKLYSNISLFNCTVNNREDILMKVVINRITITLFVTCKYKGNILLLFPFL